jgi:sulfite reductase (NADPH) flavoprotein alpha-component
MSEAHTGLVSLPSSMPGEPLSFGKRFQRTIITIHRWIGIVVCLMVMTWFISGLVLAYVPFPKMNAAQKLQYLKPVDWTRVHVMPGEALASLGLGEFPKNMRLEMSGGRPVYRITNWDKDNLTVAADTGETLNGFSPDQAVAIVRQQLSAPQATLKAADIDSDQWTMTGYWNHERPFHVVALNDPQHQVYYVSVATGEVLMGTYRTQRVLNWFGAIPHWLYFEAIRRYTHEGIWTWLIYVVSGAGIFVCLSGLWIGISRMRLRMRYTNGSWTPFKGWMKWHHVTGIFGGVTLALWLISGLFTMYPGGVLEQRDLTKVEYQRYSGSTESALGFQALASLEASAADASRVTFRYIGGRAVAVLETAGVKPRVIDAATGAAEPLSVEQIAGAARGVLPNANLVSTTYLAKGDEYWHSAYQHKKTPILRVRFDDPQETWYHIDPESGELVDLLDKTGRVNRWTVVAIHDVDLNWLLTRRPLWDLFLYAVTIPGILIAISTLVIAFRRLQRNNLVPSFAGGGGLVARAGHQSEEGVPGLSQGVPIARARRAVAADTVLVVHASQTGTAELLANRTADSFRLGGANVVVRDLGEITAHELAAASRAILVAATTGDGDPPDRSLGFQRRVMNTRPPLHGLKYAMLALGDRQYSTFCSFGMALDRWLSACGAQRVFPTVQVDDHDRVALTQWSRAMRTLTGRDEDFTLNEVPYHPWRLIERRHLNPGSAGGAAFHVRLEPESGSETWEAGDIAQIVAGKTWREFSGRQGGLIQREFSIANVPDGGMDLLIRVMRTPEGEPGVASGFLSTVGLGEAIPLRVRRNPSFYGPTDDRPMLMIGNGTGIAGLRAHIQRRVRLGQRRNWLIYGERNAAHDSFYADDLRRWKDEGNVERVDWVFSRDQQSRRYVQDQLAESAADVRSWIERDAAIYVCGSVRGMAPAVSEQLTTILGVDQLDFLTRVGRYLRDVY